MPPVTSSSASTGRDIVDFASASASLADDGTDVPILIRPIASASSLSVELHNAAVLQQTLSNLGPGQTLIIGPSDATYHVMGGIVAANLANVTIVLDATLVFSRRVRRWPHAQNDKRVMECLHFVNVTGLTLTSSSSVGKGSGVLDGSGPAWWDVPLLGYLRHLENRPRLLRITNGTDIVLERWLLLNSPYWTTYFEDADGLIVRYVGVQSRRTKDPGHGLIDLSAFNTDGLDVTGSNIHIHDCAIWTQDDIVAIKDGPISYNYNNDPDQPMRLSENILVERIYGSGLGLTIGSIGNYSHVRNVTFRDCYLDQTYKGIYAKFRHSNRTIIEDIVFENIVIADPEQFPIWIGPAQQADSVNVCRANPCSLCWPWVPSAVCKGQERSLYRDFVARNITVYNPRMGSVIMGTEEYPIVNVTWEGVRMVRQEEEEEDEEEEKSWGSTRRRWYVDKNEDGEEFPLLPMDMSFDWHVLVFQILLMVASVLLMWMILSLGRWILLNKRWSEATPRYQRLAVIMVPVSAIFATMASRIAYVTLSIGSIDEYYVCEGVVHGVALGDVNPVPHCFGDHSANTTTPTTSSSSSTAASDAMDQDLSAFSPEMGSILAAFAVLLVCAVVPVVAAYFLEDRASFNLVGTKIIAPSVQSNRGSRRREEGGNYEIVPLKS